jgi:hypothetical protein
MASSKSASGKGGDEMAQAAQRFGGSAGENGGDTDGVGGSAGPAEGGSEKIAGLPGAKASSVSAPAAGLRESERRASAYDRFATASDAHRPSIEERIREKPLASAVTALLVGVVIGRFIL